MHRCTVPEGMELNSPAEEIILAGSLTALYSGRIVHDGLSRDGEMHREWRASGLS